MVVDFQNILTCINSDPKYRFGENMNEVSLAKACWILVTQ